MPVSGDQTGLAEVEFPKVETEEPETTVWLIPFNLSLEKLDVITKACFQAKADTKPASLEDISRVAAVHARSTGPNLRFLTSIGVLTFGKGNKTFSLTQKGAEYAKHLGTGDIQAAGAVLKDLLPNSHLEELLGFIRVQGDNLTYDSLFNHIKTLARVKVDDAGGVSDPIRAGIRCLIGLLDRAKLLPADLLGQAEAARPASTSGKKQVRPAKEPPMEKVESIAPQIGSSLRNLTVSQTPFTINITIEAKDAEAIKQVIELVKKLRGDESKPTD